MVSCNIDFCVRDLSLTISLSWSLDVVKSDKRVDILPLLSYWIEESYEYYVILCALLVLILKPCLSFLYKMPFFHSTTVDCKLLRNNTWT